jgi:hypothetical protein
MGWGAEQNEGSHRKDGWNGRAIDGGRVSALEMYIHMHYTDKEIRWDASKSDQLKKERGVSFEEIITARLLAVREHPSRLNQDILLFEREGYVWAVPRVERDRELFLKTLFPSRKFTKMWKRGELS